MKQKRTCPDCGAAIPVDAPASFCPQCLMDAGAAGLATTIGGDAGLNSFRSEPEGLDTLPLKSVPSNFGDYDLVEEIARGGMGVVYKARQRSLNRTVAVKMILAGQFVGKEFVQRFRGEAAAAAILQHPNIVSVHEVGMHEGKHFFSMDYVEGRNLAEVVGNRPLLAHQAARYVKLIAEAVHYAHGQGILHRDLKPSNVLVDAATDQPRVTDFGLAKRLDVSSSLTLTGQVLGSPHFMPPEQASASRSKVGRSSDVYGLGAILYFLLTARAPFQGESLEEVVRQVIHTEPASPRLLNPSVPLDLETICLKCLEKEPVKRYATGEELAEELTRFLKREPIRARPVGRVERAWRWCRRNPVVASLGLLSLLLLVAFAAGSTIALVRINQERQRGERELYVADMNAAFQALQEGEIGQATALMERHFPGRLRPEELRGFEWRHLWEICQPNAQSGFPAPNYPFEGAVFSSDGALLAGWTTNLMVFAVDSKKLLHQFNDFDPTPDNNRKILFSNDGRLMAAKAGRSIRVWKIEDWRLIFESEDAKPNGNGGNDLALSPDGKWIWAPVDGGVGCWEVATGDRICATDEVWPPIAGDWFTGMAMGFSPDGKFLAISHLNQIAVYDSHSLVLVTNLVRLGPRNDDMGRAFRVVSLAWCTNFFGAGFRDGEFRIWRTTNWGAVLPVKAHLTYLSGLSFSPDGRLLATGGQQEHLVYLWDIASLAERPLEGEQPQAWGTLKGHRSGINSVRFSPDGQRLAASSREGTTLLWTISNSASVNVLPGSVRALRFTPDSKRLISICAETNLCAWDFSDHFKQHIYSSINGIDENSQQAVSPDGKTFALAQRDGSVELWDLATGRPRLTLPKETPVWQIDFSADSSRLVTAREPGEIKVHALGGTTGPVRVLSHLTSPFAVSSKGQLLAAHRRGGGRVELWDFAANRLISGRDIPTFTQWKSTGEALAFSPDAKRLLVTSVPTDAIEVWSVPELRLVRALPLPKPTVNSFAFSPDGRTLVIGSLDNAVTFWNTATWERMLAEATYSPAPGNVLFSPDGTWLAFSGKLAADGQRPYLLWHAPTLARIAQERTASGPRRNSERRSP